MKVELQKPKECNQIDTEKVEKVDKKAAKSKDKTPRPPINATLVTASKAFADYTKKSRTVKKTIHLGGRVSEEEEEVVPREWETDNSPTSIEQILSGSPPK